MKRVYIAGPISKGKLVDNVNRATEAFVKLAELGFAPFCPHWSVYAKACLPCPLPEAHGLYSYPPDRCYAMGTVQGNEKLSHADWLRIDLAWLAAADAVLRLPGESLGADAEVEFAKGMGIPVYHSIDNLVYAQDFENSNA